MSKSTSVQGNLDLLSKGKISKLLWDYSLPAVIGMLTMSLYNVIDRIFIGQGVGTEAIAGLAITFPVMNIATALGVLVGAGASARVSISLGANDRQSALLTLGNSLTLIIINATLYISVFTLFLDDILIAFGASERTLPYARDFMMYIMPGLFVMNIGYTFNNIMRASGYPKKAMITMFISAGCNIVFAPIFIFGLSWGIKGAAIATDLSVIIFTIYVMKHFLNPKSTITFTAGIYKLRKTIVLNIIGIGAAPSLVNVAGCAISIIINRNLLIHGGDNAVAAAGIFVTYTSLLTMIVVGICQGMQPIIGYNYGAGRYDRLRRTYLLATLWATAVVSAGAVFGLLCPETIARAFTSDSGLIKVTANAFSIAMSAFFVVGFQIVSTTLFQSLGMIWKSIALSMCRQIVFLIPLMLLLTPHHQLNGVWESFPLSDILATIVTLILVTYQFRHIHNLKAYQRT
ncbi:MAG: MATE family efflux transporter [Paramuribaculum sp.]|nr:MATE family efflux transporter [Paramuribaculum sp.]